MMGLLSNIRERMEEKQRLNAARKAAYDNTYRQYKAKAMINAEIEAARRRAKMEASDYVKRKTARSDFRGRAVGVAEKLQRLPSAFDVQNPALSGDFFNKPHQTRRRTQTKYVVVKPVRKKRRHRSSAPAPTPWW